MCKKLSMPFLHLNIYVYDPSTTPLSSVSTFRHDYLFALKYNTWVPLPHHYILYLVATFKHNESFQLQRWWPFCTKRLCLGPLHHTTVACVKFKHSRPLANLGGGAPGTCAPGVQIISFSCSFQQNNWKIRDFGELAPPPGENPGSATEDGWRPHLRVHLYWKKSERESEFFFDLGVATV